MVSPGIVCYAGKQEKPFWFSSLGQIVQFDAIIFCRTFVELFWSVQVVFKKTVTKSHDYSRLFSKEKRRLKMMPQPSRIFTVSIKNSATLDCFLGYETQHISNTTFQETFKRATRSRFFKRKKTLITKEKVCIFLLF